MKFQKQRSYLSNLAIAGFATMLTVGCGSSFNDVGYSYNYIPQATVKTVQMWDVWFDTDNGVETKPDSPLILDLNRNGQPDITGNNILGDGVITDGIHFDMDPENIAFEFKCDVARPGSGAPDVAGGFWVDADGFETNDVPPVGVQKAYSGFEYLDANGELIGQMKDDGLYHYGTQEPREWTEWLKPYGGDGLLVWDYNGDGQINNAKELFGTVGLNGEQFANGFEKLAHYFDANHDGTIDGDELEGLQVWVDENGDGVVQDGELQSLEEHGIISLNVDSYNKDTMEGSYEILTVGP